MHTHVVTTAHAPACEPFVTEMETSVTFVDPLWHLQSLFLDKPLADGGMHWTPRTRRNRDDEWLYEGACDGKW